MTGNWTKYPGECSECNQEYKTTTWKCTVDPEYQNLTVLCPCENIQLANTSIQESLRVECMKNATWNDYMNMLSFDVVEDCPETTCPTTPMGK